MSHSTQPKYFPPPETAGPDGFLGIGGKLSTEWILDAYRHGIFPWPLNDGTLAWFSPDPRAVLELDAFHLSRRMRETLRSGRFTTTVDRDFAGVMDGCASAQDRRGHTWITSQMRTAYLELHARGTAHSVEAWCGGELAGGVYGVQIGAAFAAESMFYRVRDASKVALAGLVERLRSGGFQLLDIQQATPHTLSLGATTIDRELFLQRLHAARDLEASLR